MAATTRKKPAARKAPAKRKVQIKVDGTLFDLPATEDWTGRDWIDANAICEGDLELIENSVHGYYVLALIAMRRKDPSITVDRVLELRLNQIEVVRSGAASESPLDGDQPGSTSTSQETPDDSGAQ